MPSVVTGERAQNHISRSNSLVVFYIEFHLYVTKICIVIQFYFCEYWHIEPNPIFGKDEVFFAIF